MPEGYVFFRDRLPTDAEAAELKHATDIADDFIDALGPGVLPTFRQIADLDQVYKSIPQTFSTAKQKLDLALDRVSEVRAREYLGYRPFGQGPDLVFEDNDEEARSAYVNKTLEIRVQIAQTIHAGQSALANASKH